ncbi:Holliday junction branch migration protein RuvA [Candidatus Palibaumannia cicadellinicola]|uniref:Holliday junction branch migration complex subunit RuvA n=1 Tax=Candidatus Palibaumannia cicadellinicola TaxID=186490 RepID=A0A2N4XWR1_9GAMM|nr:Holliday junction branch migration protein RuvA [Candidatus Baumannia cicadellinicola]PLK58519.1 Holliday junction branch migration protein RuvA [Candidatus Baumannia cicadellinicola]
MIGRIRGIILAKQPPLVLLETYGIGYEVYIPITYFDILPEIGEEAIFYTHFVIREDTQMLFGFINKPDMMLFRELIKVNGVGPKLALAIIAGMSETQFLKAIKHKEINILMQLPGVGKKTAERLVVEMKDKFKSISLREQFIVEHDPESEAVAALISLGYTHQNASKMVKKVAGAGANCEALIRDALRTTL